jgi:mRNA-degrading endonuclease RelE of RelBE toxin-antitoxin system
VAESVVDLTSRALEDLDLMSPDVAKRISAKIDGLAEDARPRGDTIRRLSGFDVPTYRHRIGDYRALFRVEPGVVRILRVVHRSRLDREIGDLR